MKFKKTLDKHAWAILFCIGLMLSFIVGYGAGFSAGSAAMFGIFVDQAAKFIHVDNSVIIAYLSRAGIYGTNTYDRKIDQIKNLTLGVS